VAVSQVAVLHRRGTHLQRKRLHLQHDLGRTVLQEALFLDFNCNFSLPQGVTEQLELM
jgi:hypothetical protein